MSIEFIWRLPAAGDGRYGNAAVSRRGERTHASTPDFTSGVSDPRGTAFNYFDYLHQIARAADIVGFDGIQISDDPEGDESWIVAGYLARSTRHLKLLTEFNAARGSAVYAAKNAVSYQRYTGGRFAWQIGRGGNQNERRQQGDFLPEADIAARIEEFVLVARGVISTVPFNFKGRFFEVLDGGFKGPLGHKPAPPVYLSGNNEEDWQLSAALADVHVFDALPLAALQAAISRLNVLTEAQGRQVGLGLRIDLLARETAEEAIDDAQRHLQQAGLPPGAAEGVFWSEFGTPTLVGSYAQVSHLLADYAAAGIGSFIFGSVPALEEAYRVGEYVLPAVRKLSGANGRRVA